MCFKVFTPDRSRMVGLLSKQYSGLGKELFTDASNFKVTCKTLGIFSKFDYVCILSAEAYLWMVFVELW